MTLCPECGGPLGEAGCVRLCDRCLCARLWTNLEADDYVLVRRKRGGEGMVTLKSNLNGDQHFTNLTLLHLDVHEEASKMIDHVFPERPAALTPGKEMFTVKQSADPAMGYVVVGENGTTHLDPELTRSEAQALADRLNSEADEVGP